MFALAAPAVLANPLVVRAASTVNICLPTAVSHVSVGVHAYAGSNKL